MTRVEITRQEAIRILDPVTSMDALVEIEYYAGFRGQEAVRKAVDDACILAFLVLGDAMVGHESVVLVVSALAGGVSGCFLYMYILKS